MVGGDWTCGDAVSKQIRFPSIVQGGTAGIGLGSLELDLSCGSTDANLRVFTGSVGGTFNISWNTFGDATAHDNGFSLGAFANRSAASDTESTGSYVWDDSNGNVITGTVTFYDPGGSGNCQWNGDMIQAAH